MIRERAPAKINLTLHVIGRRPDGYHELESLVAFTGVADALTLEPADALTLSVGGPTGVAAGAIDDNLVIKAARALAGRVECVAPAAFALTKRLPVAAGVGGGSSDAAAALRLLARANGIALDDPRLMAAARSVGADVPVCVEARARMMGGVGEQLGLALKLPPLFAVLVNPGVAVETRAVFTRMGLRDGEASGFGKHPEIVDAMSFEQLLAALRKGRNDMEDAAIVIAPVISDALAVIAAARGCRLARMSGSGATCFGLFETCASAAKAAKVIRRDHPGWWARATILR